MAGRTVLLCSTMIYQQASIQAEILFHGSETPGICLRTELGFCQFIFHVEQWISTTPPYGMPDRDMASCGERTAPRANDKLSSKRPPPSSSRTRLYPCIQSAMLENGAEIEFFRFATIGFKITAEVGVLGIKDGHA